MTISSDNSTIAHPISTLRPPRHTVTALAYRRVHSLADLSMPLLFVPSVPLLRDRAWNRAQQLRHARARLPRRTLRSARMSIENEANAAAADTSAAERPKKSSSEVIDEAQLPEPPVPSAPMDLEAAQSTGLVTSDGTILLEKDAETEATLTKAEVAHKEWLESLLSTADALPENHPFADTASKADVRQKPPTRRVEDWRFTDLRPVYGARYDRTGAFSKIDGDIDARRHMVDGAAAVLVFLDGTYSEERSLFDQLTMDELVAAGGMIGSLEKAARLNVAQMFDIDQLNGALQRKGYSGMFPALNAKLARDAAVIEIPKGFEMRKHVVVLNVATAGASADKTRVSAPRLAIRAAPNSRVHVLEAHETNSAHDEAHALVLSSTAALVEQDAKVTHSFANNIGREAQLLAHSHAKVEAGGTYACTNLLLNGRVSRFEAEIELNGEGSHGEILGSAVSNERRVADLHSRIVHATKHTTCRQLQKNIATDRGRTVFSGKVIVPPGSDFTEADQLCRSLLLSDKAQVDAMPVLEIATDEVKASHGATVCDLEPDELFYCQSRGLSVALARTLLIAGFVNEVLGKNPLPYMKELVRPIVDRVAAEQLVNKERQLEMMSI